MVQGQSNIPTLILLPEHVQQIGRHGEATYPEECCGLVLGKITPTERIGIELWKTENSWSKQESFTTTEEEWGKEYSKRNRFTIAPREMLRAQKEARNRQLQIMGIYHSHPDGQPVLRNAIAVLLGQNILISLLLFAKERQEQYNLGF